MCGLAFFLSISLFFRVLFAVSLYPRETAVEKYFSFVFSLPFPILTSLLLSLVCWGRSFFISPFHSLFVRSWFLA